MQQSLTLRLLLLWAVLAIGGDRARSEKACKRFLTFLSFEAYTRRFMAVPDDIEIREVGPGSEVRVTGRDQCATSALNTCLGIAVLDVRTRTAYLMHHLGGHFSGDYRQFMDRILAEAASPDDLRVALVGHLHPEPNGPHLPDLVMADLLRRGVRRGDIQTRLGSRGAWDGSYSVRVDPSTLRIFVAFDAAD